MKGEKLVCGQKIKEKQDSGDKEKRSEERYEGECRDALKSGEPINGGGEKQDRKK